MVFLSVSIRYFNIFFAVGLARVMFIWAAFDRRLLAAVRSPVALGHLVLRVFLMQIVAQTPKKNCIARNWICLSTEMAIEIKLMIYDSHDALM